MTAPAVAEPGAREELLQRPPAEVRHADELAALRAADEDPRPPGWQLSLRAARRFVVGDERAGISRKFVGNVSLVERALVTLATHRGLMLVGEPGTAKSLLSELIAAAVSGSSALTVQGGAATTEDQIKYGWNYALLVSEGPSTRSLVPAPMLRGMAEGRIVRFEEITRCPLEVQDCLLSLLSDRVIAVPELDGPQGMVFARQGFNVIATANTRDRGVNEMSAALKRRFNFETVFPIPDFDTELALVEAEATALLRQSGVEPAPRRDVLEVLVGTFRELRAAGQRQGQSERMNTVMSTAEAVSVAHAVGVRGWFLRGEPGDAADVVASLAGTAAKDSPEDLARLRRFLEQEVARRPGPQWRALHDARHLLADSVVLLGVRHHSPACGRLVARTIETLRPAYVLVEGPADMNDRLDELLLGHRLPIAVFSHYRDESRVATSWAPLCDYSPEWIAVREGRAHGADVRFIDLPAWHPAFAERADRYANRYADAEARYAEATARLCEHFGVESVDALWDGLFEVTEPDGAAESGGISGLGGTSGPGDTSGPGGIAERLDAYFALVRGDAEADAGDRVREEYMASWVRAAAAHAGGRPVLVVTGGFHQPALRTLWRREGPSDWPSVPRPPEGALGGSFLVPYSFRQLDAFAGYRSGMPSPGYYQHLWEAGPRAAAQGLLRSVAERLRARGIPVSTADLIAARGLAQGLALLRGHPRETRVDVLDGLAGALISDDLDRPLPWTTRGTLDAGSHPVVVEMIAACSGAAEGLLHPDTPLPPLVHEVTELLARLGVGDGPVTLDLTSATDLTISQTLHRLRVLGIPGVTRVSGPADGADPVFSERWEPGPVSGREAALIEAGAYGARLDEAASVALGERLRAAGTEAGPLAGLLFDTVLCGVGPLCEELLGTLAAQVGQVPELGPVGEVLGAALGLWRHDRIFGVARDRLLGTVVSGAVERVFWLVEGVHGGSGVDFARLRALVAARDALLHAPELLSVTRQSATEAAARIGRDLRAPADLRGAAVGLRWALGAPDDPAATARALASAPSDTLGDWLAGLFALARDEVAHGEGSLVDVVDGIVSVLPEDDFLTGLPALRQAFAFFPPREREHIAERLLERRGRQGSARTLLRTTADPLLLARARALEENVTRLLDRHDLRTPR
ncbi:DUF5682 family protein [Streptomyces sp. NPDC052051]|uniref:DUF5682 family protein n=1 Tax=Streptomyces sp. NPDC052051 TaxID=3154649 RepID=UPI0034256743